VVSFTIAFDLQDSLTVHRWCRTSWHHHRSSNIQHDWKQLLLLDSISVLYLLQFCC